MIFASKYKRFRLTLRGSTYRVMDGIRELVPGVQVLFMDGLANVTDENIIAQLKKHPQYGLDFWSEGQNEPNAEGKNNADIQKQMQEDLLTSCPKCPFKAQTKMGLMSHIRSKHPEQ